MNIDENTIKELMDTYGNNILRICFLYIKDYHIAEDITQETFIKVYEKYHTFKKNSDIKTWIISIAINQCKMFLRKHKLDTIHLDDISIVYTESFLQNEQNRIILEEIYKLPKKYLDVIVLYYYQDLKIEEISKILKITQSAVKSRLKRAKEKLKPNLKEALCYE